MTATLPRVTMRGLIRSLPFLAWGIASLALLLATHLSLESFRASELEAGFTRAQAAARLAENALLRSFQAARGIMDLVRLRQALFRAGDVDALDRAEAQLRDILAEGRNGVATALIISTNGTVTWSNNPAFLGLNVEDRDYFRALLAPGAPLLAMSAPLRARVTNEWRVVVARRITDEAGALATIGAIAIDPSVLSAELATIAPAPGQRLNIRRLQDGTIRATNRDLAGALERGPAPDHPAIQGARSAPDGRDIITARDGREVFGVWRRVAELPVVITSAFDLETELRDFRRIRLILWVGAPLLCALALALLIAARRNALLRRRLAEEATHDPLTGLYNRRGLARAAAAALGSGAQAAPVSLLLFDLDHFGAFNARFGHAGGDAALRAIAETLRNAVRGDDLVCRWGGEEIAVILRNCPPDQALHRAEAMRRAVEARAIPGYASVTTSVGVACAPRHGASLDTLAAQADAALYAAKHAGRNQVRLAA